MSRGKKLEVQLFGGTINIRKVPLGSPFERSSHANDKEMIRDKITKGKPK